MDLAQVVVLEATDVCAAFAIGVGCLELLTTSRPVYLCAGGTSSGCESDGNGKSDLELHIALFLGRDLEVLVKWLVSEILMENVGSTSCSTVCRELLNYTFIVSLLIPSERLILATNVDFQRDRKPAPPLHPSSKRRNLPQCMICRGVPSYRQWLSH